MAVQSVFMSVVERSVVSCCRPNTRNPRLNATIHITMRAPPPRGGHHASKLGCLMRLSHQCERPPHQCGRRINAGALASMRLSHQCERGSHQCDRHIKVCLAHIKMAFSEQCRTYTSMWATRFS